MTRTQKGIFIWFFEWWLILVSFSMLSNCKKLNFLCSCDMVPLPVLPLVTAGGHIKYAVCVAHTLQCYTIHFKQEQLDMSIDEEFL